MFSISLLDEALKLSFAIGLSIKFSDAASSETTKGGVGKLRKSDMPLVLQDLLEFAFRFAVMYIFKFSFIGSVMFCGFAVLNSS